MSEQREDIRHEVVLGNKCSNSMEDDIPSKVVLSMNEAVIAEMLKARKAYEAVAALYPSGAHIYGVEVAFFGFEYKDEDPDADPQEDGEQPLVEWEGRSECLALVVDEQGFRIKSMLPEPTNSNMESDHLSFEDFEEEVRKFRSLQMSGGLEQAMPGDDAPAPRKSGGPSIL